MVDSIDDRLQHCIGSKDFTIYFSTVIAKTLVSLLMLMYCIVKFGGRFVRDYKFLVIGFILEDIALVWCL